MFPMSVLRRGYGLVEVMAVVVIMAVLMAIGIPRMQDWIQANKAASASEFYAEGVRTARAEAVRHNAVTRLVLSENSVSGQLDWTVDLCFPRAQVRCTNTTGAWSTAAAPSTNDPEGAKGYRSVQRSAATMLKSNLLQHAVLPLGASAVYFTALGWVDTAIPARLTQIDLKPVAGASDFPASAILITLAGNAVKCNPALDSTGDSRACK